MYYLIKLAVSAVIIVLVSEVAKRSSLFGALIAALPLTSLLAIFWMKMEKTEVSTISSLSYAIFWLVIPSLLFFLIFPILLNKGIAFWLSFTVASVSTTAAYLLLVRILKLFGIEL